MIWKLLLIKKKMTHLSVCMKAIMYLMPLRIFQGRRNQGVKKGHLPSPPQKKKSELEPKPIKSKDLVLPIAPSKLQTFRWPCFPLLQ